LFVSPLLFRRNRAAQIGGLGKEAEAVTASRIRAWGGWGARDPLRPGHASRPHPRGVHRRHHFQASGP